jgi:hypothetical protein
MSWDAYDDGEPPTQVTAPLEAVTTCGAAGTASLQHLHSLLATLAPLRAAYATAAVERLHALPLEARRILVPHVLRDHPDLAHEPRIRAMAAEVGVDPDAACTTEAADRAEQALVDGIVEAVGDAARTAHDACDDLAALEARAALPAWWPRPFRDAALWTRAVAARRDRASRDAAWTAAFERALASVWSERAAAKRT